MSDPNLVTTYNLHGQDYLIKMNVVHNCLELAVTDKQTGEEWQCSYDSSYIENLTHKTGNYKQFDIFVTMLKSGLLKTSSCITLDLLTYDDLESLRIRRLKSNAAKSHASSRANNRRYLILTYTVEFDRIHYPLPLEYFGPPDPVILQATIRKLECELSETKEQMHSNISKNDAKQLYSLQKRIEELEFENDELQGEIFQLKKMLNGRPKNQMHTMQKAINNLERSVLSERKSHHRLVEQLRNEKIQLHREVDRMKGSEKALKTKVKDLLDKQKRKRSPLVQTYEQMKPRTRSISPRVTKSEGWATDDKSFYEHKRALRGSRPRSPNSSVSSLKTNDFRLELQAPHEGKSKTSPRSRSSSVGSNVSSASRKSKKSDALRGMVKSSEADFKSLEERMLWLKNLLKTK